MAFFVLIAAPGKSLGRFVFEQVVDDGVGSSLEAGAQLIEAAVHVTPDHAGVDHESARQRDDAKETARIAHKLAGSCTAVSAKEMKVLCEQLEVLGASGSLAGARDLLAQIAGELAKTELTLKEH